MFVEPVQAERGLRAIDRTTNVVLLCAFDEHLRTHPTMQRELRVHLLAREQHILLSMLERRRRLRLGVFVASSVHHCLVDNVVLGATSVNAS